MSDEIDIEEHDVLDNPNLKRIFPDLSIIKKELIEYEEGLHSALEEDIARGACIESTLEAEHTDKHNVDSKPSVPEPQKLSPQKPINQRLEIHMRFKKFLDSLTDDIFENSDIAETQSSTETQHFNDVNIPTPTSSKKSHRSIKDNKCFKNNIFILGSKPNVTNTNVTKPKKVSGPKRQLKVTLKNVSPFLEGCRRYCKHCLILFPNVDSFKFHTDIKHSSNSSNVITNKKSQFRLKSPQTKFKCNICTISLCSKGNLVRHIKMVHKLNPKKSRKITSETKTFLRENIKRDQTNTKSSVIQNHSCFHCQNIFNTRSALIEHLYNVISLVKTVSDNTKTTVPTTKRVRNEKDSDNVSTFEKEDINSKKECSNSKTKYGRKKLIDDKNCLSKENNLEHVKKTTVMSKLEERKKYPRSSKLSEKDEQDTVENCEVKAKVIDTADNGKCKVIANDDSDFDMDHLSDHDSNITSADVNEQKPGIETTENRSKKKVVVGSRLLYQCFICSQYLIYFKSYCMHMHRHNIKDISDKEGTPFDSQCHFCSEKATTIKSFNSHLLRLHPDKLDIKIKLENEAFLLQSVIFKCLKCNVFFLSANTAKNHFEHKKIFGKWQCPDCKRFFKKNDKPLHLKQHALSKRISSYAISNTTLKRFLFKCLKCAVHFSEEEYFLHHTKCDLEIPNAVYCNKCDILMNRNDMASHELHHEDKITQSLGFKFIESDIINKVVEKQNLDTARNPLVKSKFALTFCHNCNCFISNHSMKHIAHIEGRCGVLSPTICRQCGLIFTPRGYVSHKPLHSKIPNLNMQSYDFYDIKTMERMRPPAPKFPSCDICKVHFLNKEGVRRHECYKQNYKTCDICNAKLTEAAYVLHKKYHDYKLTNYASIKKKKRTELKLNKTIVINDSIDTAESKPLDSAKSKRLEFAETKSVGIQQSSISEVTDINETKFVYSCTSCHVTLDVYDRVVEHCQDHYDYQVVSGDLQETQSNNDDSVTLLKFDPFYFRFDNSVWIKHIFVNVPDKQVKKILEHSMYKFECRLKMKEIQSGPIHLTLYLCDNCHCYINPNELYLHVQTPCVPLKKHSCSYCGICFYSPIYKKIHELIHVESNVNTLSYKIISFNNIEQKQSTKNMLDSCTKFILYQCRNCDVTVEHLQRKTHQCYKTDVFKCSYCGLLLYNQEYNSHTNKHKEFVKFNHEHMHVFLFGKLGNREDRDLKPSFCGTYIDLTFHKCTKCGLCLTSKHDVPNHICVSKSCKSQCPKCYLNFDKNDLQAHIQFHEKYVEFRYDNFNFNIVTFELPKEKAKPIEVIEGTNNSSKQNVMIADNGTLNGESNSDITETIYKCICALHFMEEVDARKHYDSCNPRMKISKQSCLKCNLLFTPGELFDHLLKHHGDQKFKYKFNIINIFEEQQINGTEDAS